MRESASAQESPNWPLKVNALRPILDYCLTGLRDRFGDEADTLHVFKSCSYLNPERFPEIVASSIPDGALDHLCSLAGVAPLDVKEELNAFAKSYPDLVKNIEADFRPSVDLEEHDADFNDVSRAVHLKINKHSLKIIYK